MFVEFLVSGKVVITMQGYKWLETLADRMKRDMESWSSAQS